MRKIFLTILLTFLGVILISLSAYAVTGVCSHCHTMHNSQNGAPYAKVYSGTVLSTSTDPLPKLLIGDCVSCHTSTGAATIVDGAPIVFNTTAYPGQPLAGGNFYPVSGAGDKTRGHNVAGLTTTTDMPPPGFIPLGVSDAPTGFLRAGSTTGWGPTAWTSATDQVTCAGTWGCHGDRSLEFTEPLGSLRGAHHSNKSSSAELDGTTVGRSYRFLAGVFGAEASDWEQSPSPTSHNGYYGVNNYGSSNTISYLCGECHGNFHANLNLNPDGVTQVGSQTDASPWLRHPTDVALTNSTGSDFATDYTNYSLETPVALVPPSTSSSTVGPTSIVICLSCHVAHASQESDLLRFHYDDVSAGSGTTNGCLRCHQGVR